MIKRRIFIFSKIYYALFFIILICVIGVIGFMNIEGYSLMDAVYMTVITVSTVGFQEVVELS
jgi:voltage-gated potassium channel